MSNKEIHLLVVVSLHDFNWAEAFKGEKVNGSPIKVLQANWTDLVNVSYQEEKSSTVQVSIKGIKENKIEQDPIDCYTVDFLLFRTVCRGRYTQDARNFLFTFMHGGIPAVNSIESIWLNSERPIGYGLLNRVKQRVGYDKFPLISQTYWPSFQTMKFAPSGSAYVLKYGAAHAGYGKVLIETEKKCS